MAIKIAEKEVRYEALKTKSIIDTHQVSPDLQRQELFSFFSLYFDTQLPRLRMELQVVSSHFT